MSTGQFQSTYAGTPAECQKKSVRVLHVVENLDRQAVESWLLRILKAAANEHPHVQWSFFCVLGKSGRFDDEARALGAEVIHSRYPIGDKIHFMTGLREVMKNGNYDVLHCHHDIMSAAYLLASIGLPFRKRIVHLHNTSMSLPTPSRLKSEVAREPMRQICLRMADQIVGISNEALESLLGNTSIETTRHSVVHYAVDTERFSQASHEPCEFRLKLGFSPLAKVLLFVGRMVEYKNPLFVIEILEHLLRIDSEAVAVFAGTGDLEDAIRETVNQKNLNEHVRLLGFRHDVPELMLGADLLVWPSVEKPMEGLGLGVIEAQAAGLPVLMSQSVPEEAIVMPELVQVLPLSAGAMTWAGTIAKTLRRPRPNRKECLATVESSSFSMASGVANFINLYESQTALENPTQ